jgi:hypothetical protein
MAEEKDGLLAKARRKLVESKQLWAREGRLLTGQAGSSACRRASARSLEERQWIRREERYS